MQPWVDDWIESVRQQHGHDAGDAAHQLLTGAEARGLAVRRQAPERGGVSIGIVVPGLANWPDATPVVGHDARGTVGWEVKRLANHPPFNAPPMLEQLRERILTITGIARHKESYPDVRFEELATNDEVPLFLEILEWVTGRLRKFN